MTKAGVEEFVGVAAGPAAVVENDARGGQYTTAGFENSVVEFDDTLGGRIFKHRYRQSLVAAVAPQPQRLSSTRRWRRRPSGCKRQDGTWLARLGRGRVRFADEKAVGAR